jgi:hypothetical protein
MLLPHLGPRRARIALPAREPEPDLLGRGAALGSRVGSQRDQGHGCASVGRTGPAGILGHADSAIGPTTRRASHRRRHGEFGFDRGRRRQVLRRRPGARALARHHRQIHAPSAQTTRSVVSAPRLSARHRSHGRSFDTFRATWKLAGITKYKTQERLAAFCHFCVQRDWFRSNFAMRMGQIRIKPVPTLPFEEDEVQRIIELRLVA